MEINLEACRNMAVKYGLPLQFIVKEFYVFDVLSKITAQQPNIVFKGGTALNKVYLGKLQRFSDDLDFDSGTESMGEVQRLCRELSEGMEGYEIVEFRRVGSSLQFYCTYDSPLGGKDHVRVDIAAKRIVTDKPVVVKAAMSSYTQQLVSGFHVYSLEDLVARKMHALCTRAEGKDVYDVYNALPLCGRMENAIKKMLQSERSEEGVGEFLKRTIQAVRKMDYRKLRNLTNPFIPLNNRPRDWLELKNDLLAKLEGMHKL
ncbi:MAG: nucleotidyl transferase AbiEii/AbiGii toxin family protein [Candidatus Freyarchaeota archaeon]